MVQSELPERATHAVGDRMTYDYRIAPKNALVIEWKPDLPDTRWCFYKTNDSPNDAKRSLNVLRHGTDSTDAAAQPMLIPIG